MKNSESLDTSTEVCLVSTYSPNHASVVSESLGSEALAGDLIGEFGDEVDVSHLDLQIEDMGSVKERVRKVGRGIVGVSAKIGSLAQLDEIVTSVRQGSENPSLVLGGVVPTFATDELLRRYPEAIIAVGEAELAMRGLVEHTRNQRALETIPGIAFIKDGEKIQTDPRRIDLADLRLPARLTTERVYKDHEGLVWFEGSRGCDWHCTFCSRRSLRGEGFSGNIPVSHVVDDLENLSRMGIRSAHASDDDWGGDTERNLAIAEEILARNIDMKWSISTRADHIWKEVRPGDNPEDIARENQRLEYIIRRQMAAGLDRVFLGLESFSPSQLKRYGKSISAHANYQAVKVLHELGVNVVAGYIPIDPLMDLGELRENLAGLRATGMYKNVSSPLSILRIQEGSAYLKMAQIRGRQDGVNYVGERSDDLVFYEIENYRDGRVQKIADIAKQWIVEMHPIIFDLKMELFSATQDSILTDLQQKWSENTLERFRELEMQMIESATNLLMIEPNGSVSHIVNEFNKRRLNLLQEVSVEMAKMGVKLNNSSYLMEVIGNAKVA